MLGQAVRRFATSAVRSSHYAEGPGKVRSSFPRIYIIGGLVIVFGLVFSHMLTIASFTWRSSLSFCRIMMTTRSDVISGF